MSPPPAAARAATAVLRYTICAICRDYCAGCVHSMCDGGGACVFWDMGWLAIDTIVTTDWWDKYDDDYPTGAAADFEAAAAADV